MNISLTTAQNTVIYSYFIPVSGLIFLLMLINKNHLFSRKQSQLFRITIYINLLLIAATSCDYLMSAQTTEYIFIFRRITSMVHFSIAPLLPFMLLRLYSNKKMRFAMYIPLIINAACCILSFFVKVVFFITIENKYARGPLFLIPFCITIFYLLCLIFSPMTTNNQGKRQELSYLGAVLFLMMLAMVLEVFLHFKCLEYGASSIGLIMYYILQNIHFFSSDPLTGAYNRQMYNHMLTNLSKTPQSIFALVDLNDFKIINDVQGHDAGDKALILFVSILNQSLHGIALIYRIGGDEFMLVSHKTNKSDFVEALETARRIAAENALSFAYGMTVFHAGDNVEDMLHLVDKEMYAAKNSMKLH